MKPIMVILLGLSVAGAVQAQGLNSQQAIKQDILRLAKSNTSNTAGLQQTRQELNELVDLLIQNQPLVSEMDWVEHSPGAWRQIWSDEADNSPPGSPARNLEKIFQYVTKGGRAVNFGERILPGGKAITFALEAVGSVSGNIQNTKILKAFSRGQGLEAGDLLAFMAEDVLSGQPQLFTEIEAGEFPNGPINAQSDLTILFLDRDLKIGTAPNVYSGKSEMFVLERVTSVH